MSSPLVVAYPHDARSLEPHRMTARQIWAIAIDVRQQMALGPLPKLDVARVISRCQRLTVNGRSIETQWELQQQVLDERSRPAMGAVDFDPQLPGLAMVSMNPEVLADRDDLARSTAGHELAHVIFEAPGWMRSFERHALGTDQPAKRYRKLVGRNSAWKSGDWAEWRANEFMGAFAVPPKLVVQQMRKLAPALGLRTRTDIRGNVSLDPGNAGAIGAQALADELAEAFGVSVGFMEVRLTKYGYVQRAGAF
jgi:hypothetical protein